MDLDIGQQLVRLQESQTNLLNRFNSLESTLKETISATTNHREQSLKSENEINILAERMTCFEKANEDLKKDMKETRAFAIKALCVALAGYSILTGGLEKIFTIL